MPEQDLPLELPMNDAERTLADFPRAHSPDRRYRVDAHGIDLAVCEWGPQDGAPLLLAHGGFDFAQTFSVFAPLLSAAGYRVVSWDQRGHGDSEHATLYSTEADIRDALCILDSISPSPIPFIGHSKGGSLLTQLALATPHRASHLVVIDGLPSRRALPDVPDHERTRLRATTLSNWLDHRRRTASSRRRPGTLEELAERRARMNPRLSHAWLAFLATRGANKLEDGWRWKIDPTLRFGGFGPWHPSWALRRLPGLAPPMLGLLAGQREPMGFDSRREDLLPFLPRGAQLETFEDAGHFIHIEDPDAVASMALEFISR